MWPWRLARFVERMQPGANPHNLMDSIKEELQERHLQIAEPPMNFLLGTHWLRIIELRSFRHSRLVKKGTSLTLNAVAINVVCAP